MNVKIQSVKSYIHNLPISGVRIYFLAFAIYFFPTFLMQTTFGSEINSHFLRLISYISIPLLLYKIFIIDKMAKKELIATILLLGISVIIWRSTQNSDFLFIFPLLFGAKNIEFKKIVKWYLNFNFILIVSVMIIALLKIIPNLIYYSSHRPTRYSLGMVFPSNIAAFFLFMSLAYCYLKFNHLKFWDYAIIFVVGCIGMKLTNTRLDFLSTILIIPIMIIAQRAYRGNFYSKVIASFFWMAVPITGWLVLTGSFFYTPHNSILRKLNSLSSGRLVLGYNAFQRFKPNLFGRSIKEYSYAGVSGHKFANNFGQVNHNYFYIDSSYLRMLLLWGIIAFIIIIICYSVIAVRSTAQRTYILSAIILIISLNLMFEPHVIQIIYNPFLLSLFAIENYTINKESTYE